jgi:hypothetical protein
MLIVLKSGNLNLLQPSRPCPGIYRDCCTWALATFYLLSKCLYVYVRFQNITEIHSAK